MAIRIDGTNTTANPGITGADADTGLQFGTNELKLVTGGTEAVKIGSNQKLTASQGILFGTDTAAANTLDDYEEGTFTPTVSSGITSPSLTSAQGHYVKVGTIVMCSVDFRMNGNQTGNGDAFKIGGLPFNNSTDGSIYGSATIQYNSILGGFTELRAGHFNETSTIHFFNGTNIINGNTAGVNLANQKRIIMQLVYKST